MDKPTSTPAGGDLNRLFIGFGNPRRFADHSIYLVNNTPVHYARVVALTGMFTSVDDGLLESSKARGERGALAPYSALLLEDGPFWELDYVIWYHLDLFPGDESQPPMRVWFDTPKGGPTGPDIVLPVLNQRGHVIDLKGRPNEPPAQSPTSTALPAP